MNLFTYYELFDGAHYLVIREMLANLGGNVKF